LNIGSKSGGAGAGKVQFKEFSVEKTTDNGSAGLFRTCCSGGHYNDVELVLRRSGGDKLKSGTPFLVYKFKLVAVKDITWSGSDGDDVPNENVVFEFGAIQIEYTQQKTDGSKGATDTQKWSRVKNANEFSV
jgi:type VI secretion system secreted protein Hcp